MKYCIQYPIEGPKWRDWMTNWGYRTSMMVVPETIYEKTHELMRKYGYLNEGEIILRAMRVLESSVAPIVSLKRSHSSDSTLKGIFGELIKSVEKVLYIAVQMIDTTYVEEIINAANRKAGNMI